MKTSLTKKLFYLTTYLLLPFLSYSSASAQMATGADNAGTNIGAESLFSQLDRSSDSLAPDFTLKSLTQGNIRLNELRGNIVLIMFWASWNGKSRNLIHQLDSVFRQHEKQGFEILAVCIDPKNVFSRKSRYNVPYTILGDTQKTVAKKYGITTLPSLLLIDRDGYITFKTKQFHPDLVHEIHHEIQQIKKNEH